MRSALLCSVGLVLVAACAASSKAPMNPDPTDDVSDGGVVLPSASAPAPIADGGAPADAHASGASGASGASAAEAPDSCTPIGVDFEQRARPKLKDCYRDGKKKNPDLKGVVRLTVDIDTLGKIKAYRVVEKTLPEPVVACMLKVVKSTPFPEASKCTGKSITIPMAFPTN